MREGDLRARGSGRRGPRASVASAAARNTSVLPLPVTPWSRNDAVAAAAHRRRDGVGGGALLRGERETRVGRVLAAAGSAGASALDGLGDPGAHQRAQGLGARRRRRARRAATSPPAAVREQPVGARAGRRPARQRAPPRPARAGGRATRIRSVRRFRQSRRGTIVPITSASDDEIVARRPAAQLEEVGRQERLGIDAVEHRAQVAGGGALREAGDHADAASAARAARARACRGTTRSRSAVGHAVGEAVVARNGRKRRDLDQPVHDELGA